MDRKRIEWLFLIIFALIDIYLALEILRSPVSLSNADTNTSSATNIRIEMRADGIDLPGKISHKQQSGYYLAAKNRDYLSGKISSLSQVNAHYSKSNNNLTATPKTAVLLNGNSKDILQQIIDFKNDPKNVPYGKKFKYEASMSGNDSYCFVQNSNYGAVYDNGAQLLVTVHNKQIDNYTISYMGPVNSVREPQLIISAWRAVSAMYTDREIGNNSKVMQIKLGYSKLTQVRGNTILLPSWLIWVENKTTKNITLKRVNAFTAQVLQTNNSYDMGND
ncbi:two-component system regulatory protein YycI [Lactobacillus sp. ESL0791]|uniref:two-component system regulatory protein YycI n=1 Tax=Lactobacillus sp. ESL0791 TaxID=2983234 RepID=UPI0023F650E1|nr:two-component system regulatory protein YycI [Lactobacillus sp. ESL0791]MDF7637939.1 two-component system regulatory protein YycI [Lactobacillus sp. ESL0791]